MWLIPAPGCYSFTDPDGWKAKLAVCWLLVAKSAHNQKVYRPIMRSLTAFCSSSLWIVTRWEFWWSDLQYSAASFQSNFIVYRARNVLRRKGSSIFLNPEGIPRKSVTTYTHTCPHHRLAPLSSIIISKTIFRLLRKLLNRPCLNTVLFRLSIFFTQQLVSFAWTFFSAVYSL